MRVQESRRERMRVSGQARANLNRVTLFGSGLILNTFANNSFQPVSLCTQSCIVLAH